MKILVDVSAGVAIADYLRASGHDVQFVRDVNPTMPDVDILAWAVREGRLVVTMDKDVGELVFQSKLPHCGVLLLRLEAARTAQKIAVVEQIFNNHLAELIGKFSVYQDHRLRIR